MKYVDGILAAQGDRLMAFEFNLEDYQQKQVSWNGKEYKLAPGAWFAEWMELEDSCKESLLGVQLHVYDWNTPFTDWLNSFSNTQSPEVDTSFDIFFREPVGTYEPSGPFLPVETFVSEDGDFLVFIRELLPKGRHYQPHQ